MAKKKPATKTVAKKPVKPAAKSRAPAKKVEAKKSAKPAPKKAVPSKAPAKKAVATKSSAKTPAKKVVSVKPVAKAPVKKVVATKAVAKVVAKKVVPKVSVPAKKVEAKKVEAKKVEAKKVVAPQKGPSKAELAAKAKADAALLAKKNKEQEKLAKEKQKNDEKKARELAKAKEKEDKEKAKLKAKGKGKINSDELPFEDEEERVSSVVEEDEDDDFESEKPTKVKMTFDEVEDVVEVPIRRKKPTADDDIKEALAEEILALSEEFKIDQVFAAIRDMELFKIESDECVVRGCDNPSTSAGYCRYHYIKLWKDVKKKEAILSEGKLAKMIEELVRKYPMKYVESIISDLADDKAFYGVLKELDIEADESDLDTFEDDDLLDDDQDIAFETKVTGKPMLDD